MNFLWQKCAGFSPPTHLQRAQYTVGFTVRNNPARPEVQIDERRKVTRSKTERLRAPTGQEFQEYRDSVRYRNLSKTQNRISYRKKLPADLILWSEPEEFRFHL